MVNALVLVNAASSAANGAPGASFCAGLVLQRLQAGVRQRLRR